MSKLTTVCILKNVPLDTTYEHTIYFSSTDSQVSYFSSLSKYKLTNYSYQRIRRGTIRVGIVADNLYDCNYLMFQNSSYGNKWFYAFITSCEYINDETSELTFEIDVMQTWMFNYNLQRCFVQREHAVTDGMTNLQPEPVSLGEPVLNKLADSNPDGYKALLDLKTMCIIFNTIDLNQVSEGGGVFDGVYGAGVLTAFNTDDLDGIKRFLTTFAQKTDNIISVYMCPKAIIASSVVSGGTSLVSSQISKHVDVNLPTAGSLESVGGYIPKNKKLFTYPYNYVVLSNASGDSLTLRYEYFTEYRPQIRVNGCVTQPVQIVARPRNYKNATECYSEGLSLGNFPMCSWAIDGYQAYIAQTAIPALGGMALNMLGTAGLVLAGGASAGEVALQSTASSTLTNISNLLVGSYKSAVGNDISRGNFNTGNANVSMGTNQLYWGRMSVSANYAEVIDNFFDMYGYATNRVKVPNTHSRPHWNYVKTQGCCIKGSVPAPDMRKICSIYDSGITFWKNGSEVGNYSLDNRPS